MENYSKYLVSVVVVAILCVAGKFALHAMYPSGAWRYRMTVSVQTPEGIKIGSAVRQMIFHTEPHIFSEQGGTYYYLGQGEAVIVGLGKRGMLFALMQGDDGDVDYGHLVALEAFPLREKTIIGAKKILTPRQYPMFVRFRDIKDPKTVERVVLDNNPRPSGIQIGDAFGEGVKLNKILIERTDDPVTSEIEKPLPWLSTTFGYISGGHMCFKELYECLDSGSFERRKK